VSVGFGHHFASILQNTIKELPVSIRETVSLFLLFALRKGCVRLEEMPNVGAAPLNELGSETATVGFRWAGPGKVGRQGSKIRIQQRSARTGMHPLYRCARVGCDKDNVAVGVGGEAGNELVAADAG